MQQIFGSVQARGKRKLSVTKSDSVPLSSSTSQQSGAETMSTVSLTMESSPSERAAVVTGQQILDLLDSDTESGLSSTTAAALRLEYGPNELGVEKHDSLLTGLLEQFQNPLILLLLGSAALSILLGNIEDAVSIAVAVIIVVTVAFVQEYRSEKSLEALNRLAPPNCHLIRFGLI